MLLSQFAMALAIFTAATPPGAEAPAWLGHAYTDAAGARWQEINLRALSQQPRFLSIGA